MVCREDRLLVMNRTATALTNRLAGIARMHGSVRFLVASVIVVGVGLALLRIVYAPGEEALLASIAAAQQAEERARAGTDVVTPPTPTAAVAGTDAAAASATTAAATTAAASAAEATTAEATTVTAAPTTPEPTPEVTDLALGEPATAGTNLQITLLDVYAVPSIPQYFGRDAMPQNGVFVVVVARFENPTTALIQYSPHRVHLIDDRGARFGYDDVGTNGLSTTPKPVYEGRPLIFAESLHPGGTETVSIVFDLESAADEIRVEIEDLIYSAPVREDVL